MVYDQIIHWGIVTVSYIHGEREREEGTTNVGWRVQYMFRKSGVAEREVVDWKGWKRQSLSRVERSGEDPRRLSN